MNGNRAVMSGWCNGSAGQVFLWTLAHRVLGDKRWLEMAERAAWNSWESTDTSANLCCGLVGRAYALLNFFRHTGDETWLDRARTLGNRAAATGGLQGDYRHSLFKGELGLAVLAAHLEAPDQAVMPFFEPFGYSAFKS
jgi:serine/threonine-protein kinase